MELQRRSEGGRSGHDLMFDNLDVYDVHPCAITGFNEKYAATWSYQWFTIYSCAKKDDAASTTSTSTTSTFTVKGSM